MKAIRTYKIAAEGLLVALALVFQLGHGIIGWPTNFGMTVDLVGFPALLAFFLFGFKSSLRVLLLTTLGIIFLAPSGIIGAAMKLSATVGCLIVLRFGNILWLPVLLILAGLSLFGMSMVLNSLNEFALYLGAIVMVLPFLAALAAYFLIEEKRTKPKDYGSLYTMAVLLVCAILLRGAVTVISNVFFAVPTFFPSDKGYLIQVEQIITALLHFWIFLWNAVQQVVEFSLAWVVAYTFKFKKKYGDKA